MFKEYDSLGPTFEVRSGELLVTDPYCGLTGPVIENALNGRWEAFARYSDEGGVWGRRTAELLCWCAIKPDDWERTGTVGVDAGSAGVYDPASFGVRGETMEEVADRNRQRSHRGGATVYSGYGDGGYPIYVGKDEQGRVCGVKIVFIDLDHPKGTKVRIVEDDTGSECYIPGEDDGHEDLVCERCGGTSEVLDGQCAVCRGTDQDLVPEAHGAAVLPADEDSGMPVEALIRCYGPTLEVAQAKAREKSAKAGWIVVE